MKQHFTAKAAITLGKDLVFRDYAQGAFRMRGIETGQRLGVLIVPELLHIVAMATHSASTQLPAGDVLDRAQRERVLSDVVGWLTINAMASERVQASLLVKQNLLNVWRSRHFKLLAGNFLSFFLSSSSSSSSFY